MSGWISIHRKIQEHWLWEEKPFDKRSAWIDLILMASYRDNKFLLGNELVEVERGGFITSEVKLSEKWGWSRTKVRSFLELLEKDNMILKKSDNRKTYLKIVNYNDYQVSETTKEQPKDNEETTKEQPKDTINKDNKDNKENNIIMTPYEAEYISVLEKIKGYPLDRKKDLEYMKELEKRYPTLDLVEAIKKFSIWILDNPFKKNANHRSQINTSFSKYVEWGVCLKKESKPETKKAVPLKMVFMDDY
jgi:hypothetical protein